MATQQKLKFKFTEAERKKLNKYIENLPKESPRQRVFEYEERYIQDPYRRERPLRGSLIMTDKINHCKSTGGTMSECSACQLKRGEKVESQKKCHFYKKATFKDRCTFETFGEYCWCVEAQVEAKKG